MSPVEVAAAVRLRLAAEIADDRSALETLASDIARLVAPAADPRDEWMRGSALAFELERFYTAVEALLTRVLRAIDGDVPSGPSSHLDIPRAASVPIDGGRPAVVTTEIAGELRDLLKFRHLARHGYESRPQVPRLEELARTVARVRHPLVASLAAFDRWLRTT